ncbi:MAG: type II secretion system F family protein [Fimbriimonadaceae bacterium]
MPVYSYTLRDNLGGIQKGTAEAETEELLRQRFSEQGFTVTEIEVIRARSKKYRSPGRVSQKNLAVFCRQFSTMVDAGVSLVRCLDVLAQQTNDPKLKKILIDLGERVESGESLSKAMQRHPRTFDNLFIGLIRAGEVGGVLEESLQRLSQFLERNVELRRKVKSAMTYPALVLFFAIAIVGFLVFWFIPQWVEILKGLGIDEDTLPLPTKFLMDLSYTMVNNWYIYLGVIIVVIIAWKLFVSTRFGRRTWDRVKLKIPLFGKLHHRLCMTRFSRTMGTLLGSGVPILQAMETVSGTVGNTIMADAVLEARAKIREGDRIADPLERSRLFPPMVVHMIGVGEESGSLDFMLQKIAEFYESEVEAMLAQMTAALEPIMIVGLGFIVGFIVISLFLPLVDVIAKLSSGEDTGSGASID